MIKSFDCFKEGLKTAEIAKVLYGSKTDVYIMNGLTWFALEEVARYIYDR